MPTVVQHTPEDLRVLLDDLPCRSPPAACGASSWATPSAALSLAQQFAGEFAAVSAPFQYALAARAGAESLARGVRLATELDPRTSVLSIRGGLRSFTITSPGPACCKACKTNGSRPSFRTSRSFKAGPSAYIFYGAYIMARLTKSRRGAGSKGPTDAGPLLGAWLAMEIIVYKLVVKY